LNGGIPGLSGQYCQELISDKVELGADFDNLMGRKTPSFTFLTGNGFYAS